MPAHEPNELPEDFDPRLVELKREFGDLKRDAVAGFPLEPVEPRPPLADVDPGAQALVWAVTASSHTAEALTALHRLSEMDEQEATGRVIVRAEERREAARLRDYHTRAAALAEKAATMWSMTANLVVQYVDEPGQSGTDNK